jgi:hypothetical protein
VSIDDSTQTLDEYLKQSDEISKGAYEGKPSKTIDAAKNILIDNRAGIQRGEFSLAGGFASTQTYIKNNSAIYTLGLYPRAGSATEKDKQIYDKIIASVGF